MTSDKCEHHEVRWQFPEGTDGKLGEALACTACGTRFVPEDLLREARDFIFNLECAALVNDGGGHFDEMPCCPGCKSLGAHDAGCPVRAMLAKIDAVLGLNPPAETTPSPPQTPGPKPSGD